MFKAISFMASLAFLSVFSGTAHAVPANAQATANGWSCNTGFKRQAQQCNKIFIPPNAVLSGQGWVCKSGFVRAGQQCNASTQAASKSKSSKSFSDLLNDIKAGDARKKKAVEDAVVVYRKGQYKRAFSLFTPLANKGEKRAEFYIGLMFGKGQGVLKDRKQAAKWFLKSAKKGYSAAQYNLATMLRTGDGVPKNPKRSVYWYSKASAQGNAYALHYLGMSYYTGNGVLKDQQRGLDFIRQSALKGDRESQYFLGLSYCNGAAVILSKRQCAIWVKRAYDNGHPKASALWEKHQLWNHQ